MTINNALNNEIIAKIGILDPINLNDFYKIEYSENDVILEEFERDFIDKEMGKNKNHDNTYIDCKSISSNYNCDESEKKFKESLNIIETYLKDREEWELEDFEFLISIELYKLKFSKKIEAKLGLLNYFKKINKK
ncbi:hypothetical protein DMUE_3565 [Dictyocoela muelleri]|nr:hypothetical protein DMUE_3565 [Dictyocoela muelleri]